MTKRSTHWLARCLGLALLGCCATDVLAEDWPQFRGPTGQGISTEKNLPIQWGPEENVAWKAAIPGLGWSSPILVGGKIYLTTAVPVSDEEKADHSLRVLRLDAASGEIEWNEEVFVQEGATAPGIHDKNSHASPTPLLVNNRLYVHFGHMGTACYEIRGSQLKPLWKTQELKYSPVHGNGCSPIYVEGLIVFSADGAAEPMVAALDAETGAVRWKYPRPATGGKTFSFATPLAIKVAGRTQIVAPAAGSVSGIDPATGKEIWHVLHDGYSVIPRPVFANGLVYLSTSYDSAVAMAIRPDGEGNVTETHVVWQAKKGAPHTPSMLAVGDAIYMVADDGVASCLDAQTGKPHWQQRVGGNYSSSPVYADGKIYLQNEDGKGVVLAAEKKFKKLAENGFGERTLASYAVGDGAIFVRTKQHLYRVEEN